MRGRTGGGPVTQERSAHKKVVKIEGSIALQALAAKLGIKAGELLMKLMSLGMTGININSTLDSDTAKLVRSQDLAPIFEDNNAIHLFTRRSFTARRSRIGVSPLMHPISKIEATDIDWPDDFEIAEALMARRLNR